MRLTSIPLLTHPHLPHGLRPPRLGILLMTVVLLLAPMARTAEEPDEGSGKPIDFAHDIVPVLKKHCVECHGGEKAEGGFSLNQRSLILESDAAEPGHADASRMIELITSQDLEERMPPQEKPGLDDQEIALVRRWIDEGLKWEDGFSFAEARYEPPLRLQEVQLPEDLEGIHPIDHLIAGYRQRLELPIDGPAAPAGQLSDAAFLRRVSLDLVGLLPTPDELQAFLDNSDPHKRKQVVRRLLEQQDAYAVHWLSFWNDLLRNDYKGTGYIDGGRKQISQWLYDALVTNKPYDQFVQELISPTEASEGFIRGIKWRGSVNASQIREVQFAQNISQVFLGINMKCASCHDSFIDRWTLKEAYGLAAIYSDHPLEIHRCDKPTGEIAEAGWIFPELGTIDNQATQPERLRQLAGLMTHPDNGRFSRTIVNRLWHRLMGRGIVHPVDAMSTAPWDEALLDFLAADLIRHDYDLKRTLELIVTSRAYQTPAVVQGDSSETSGFVYQGPHTKRLTAEQFVDAIWQITRSGPSRPEAPIQRREPKGEEPGEARPRVGKWIWSYAGASNAVPKAGERITLKKSFDLASEPRQAVLAITCDNAYRVFVNGKLLGEDTDWPTVETLPCTGHLEPGRNELLIVAQNLGDAPNPAALFAQLEIRLADQEVQTVASDATWQWTEAVPDKQGRLPGDAPWKDAREVQNQAFLGAAIQDQIQTQLNSIFSAQDPRLAVRAALVTSDLLMRSLGRPNREQVVTTRPTELTTLQAIDLANGQILADLLSQGARNVLSQGWQSPDELTVWLYQYALARTPTEAELRVGRELLGDATPLEQQRVADLLWAVFMLPEFQLIR